MRKNEAELHILKIEKGDEVPLWAWVLCSTVSDHPCCQYYPTEELAKQAGREWAKEHNIEVVK